MIPAPLPIDEAQRLAAVRALGLLDTAPEESFDRITRLTQRMFGVPASFVTLVDRDRQWIKSDQGLGDYDSSRSRSFCGHTIAGNGPMIVEDTLTDPRFADHPLSHGDPPLRFYAGVPLATPDGHQVGSLCLIDHEPRTLSLEDLAVLTDLALVVEHELSIRHDAVTDRLTGLYNRRGLDLAGEGLVELADQLEQPISVLFVDLDGMKPINDVHGHAAGDAALVAGARLLRQIFRRADLVARIGGDEFVIVLSSAGDATIEAIIDRLTIAVTEFNADSAHEWDLRLSVGSATREPDGGTFADLLARADAAMYEVKRARRSAPTIETRPSS